MHFLRQRRAMRKRLCQICGGKPADAESMRWLLGRREYEENPWPAAVVTSHPPVCPPCGDRAVRACPHFRRGHVALRATKTSLAGVRGVLHVLGPAGPVSTEAVSVGYDDPRIRWVRAA